MVRVTSGAGAGQHLPRGQTRGPQRLAVALNGPPDLHLNPIYVTWGSLPTASFPSSVKWESEPCIAGSGRSEVRGTSRRASTAGASLQPSVLPQLRRPGRACGTVGVRSQESAGMSRVFRGSPVPSRSEPKLSRLVKAISKYDNWLGGAAVSVVQLFAVPGPSGFASRPGAQSPNL